MRSQRANSNAVFFLANLVESWHRLQVDKKGIVNGALLHENNESRAAGNETSIIAVLQQKLAGFREGVRPQKIEGLNRHNLLFREPKYLF